MKQLSQNTIGPNVVEFFARRSSVRALTCQWRLDPSSGALVCVWTLARAARAPAPPVPLRRAA